jgi:tight adherence protein B
MINWYLRNVKGLLEYADITVSPRKFLWFNAWLSVLGSAFMLLIHTNNPMLAILTYAAVFVMINIAIFGFLIIVKNGRAQVANEMLPDYLLLFSNNLKSGYTPEQAMIVSAKEEFGVLSKEVARAMRGSVSGKPIEELLPKISERIDSDVIRNTFSLIVEGINSGGDLSKLLEQTSYDVRRFDSVKKDIYSVISVYELFIAAAAGIAAPLLIGTSIFIVNVILSIKAKTTTNEVLGGGSIFLSAGPLEIDAAMLNVFSFVSLLVITFFASLAIGLIKKGTRVEGLKYFPILFAIGAAVLIIVRGALELGLGGLFTV